jgi:Cu/Ag efflux protein CusF
MVKIYTFFILISLAFACGQKAAEIKKPESAPAATTAVSPTPQPSPSVSKNRDYDGRGVVTKIDLELVSVEIRHEKIEGLMPAMTMEFYVSQKSELEKLKIGDAVEFVLRYKDGQEKIVSIKKAL